MVNKLIPIIVMPIVIIVSIIIILLMISATEQVIEMFNLKETIWYKLIKTLDNTARAVFELLSRFF